jgi:hypothetical protein
MFNRFFFPSIPFETTTNNFYRPVVSGIFFTLSSQKIPVDS